MPSDTTQVLAKALAALAAQREHGRLMSSPDAGSDLFASAWQGCPPLKPLLVLGVLVLFAAFVVAQITALRRLRGLWRVAAAAPAGIMLFVVLRIVVEMTADSSPPHDQWLYEILIWSGISLGLLALVRTARALCAPRREES
jgi:hypothetical protein